MANEDWAKDPHTRPEVLAMLATSPSEAVRLMVAQNPSTPETALLHLAKDDDDSVRKALTHRTQVSSEVLRVAALPREMLEQLPKPAEANADSVTAPAPPTPQPVTQTTEPVAQVVAAAAPVTPFPAAQDPAQTPAAASKPSLFAWFWRLFGRSV